MRNSQHLVNSVHYKTRLSNYNGFGSKTVLYKLH